MCFYGGPWHIPIVTICFLITYCHTMLLLSYLCDMFLSDRCLILVNWYDYNSLLHSLVYALWLDNTNHYTLLCYWVMQLWPSKTLFARIYGSKNFFHFFWKKAWQTVYTVLNCVHSQGKRKQAQLRSLKTEKRKRQSKRKRASPCPNG